MTLKVMKSLLLLSLILTSVSYANEQVIVRSKEDIVFHTPDMFKFSDVGKISEFRGVIDRTYFSSSDLKMIDFYQFNTDDVRVSNSLCLSFIEKIFALKRSKLYKLKYLRIEPSNKGNVCEALVTDKNTVKEDPYLRVVTVGFVNARASVLVYHPRSIEDSKITEIRKFWNSLR